MKSADKKLKRRYGQAICDFINAKDTYKALLTYLGHIRVIRDFSASFKEQAAEKFRSIKAYDSLNSQEKELVWLLISLKDLSHSFVSGCSNFGIDVNYSIEYPYVLYYPDFTFTEVGPEPGEPETVHLDLFVEKFQNEIGDASDITKFIQLIEKIKKAHNDIEKLRSHVGEEKSKYLGDNLTEFKKIISFLNKIEALQKGYQWVLEGILSGKKFEDIKGFNSIVYRYNWVPKDRLILTRANEFLFESTFKEADYFTDRSFFCTFLISRIKANLAFFLIEFLREQDNQKFVRKCTRCDNYFIGKTLRFQKYCSPECKDLFHRDNRKKTKYHTHYMRKYPRR